MSEGRAKLPISARGGQERPRLEQSGNALFGKAERGWAKQSKGAKAQECLTIK